MKKVVFLNHSNGEWQAVYIDGKKVFENDYMQADDLVGALGIDYDWIDDADHLASDPGGYKIFPAYLPENYLEPSNLKRPTEWAKEFGIEIMDPDGWRHGMVADFNQPIDREDFERRMMVSTIRMVDFDKFKATGT